jgi:hypothetical protein
MARKRELDAEARRERAAWKKAKIAEKRKRAEEEKARKQASLSGTTLRQKPPAIYDSNRGSKVEVTPNLGFLEALFEENKIRSYKMDGDMRNRRFMARALKAFKNADLILAIGLFTQNRFLMDANAHGWRVARANALKNEEQEPWVNGKRLNSYQDWCPSQVWFVRNIHKILEGAYQPKTREERLMNQRSASTQRDDQQLEMDFALPSPSQISVSLEPSSEELALIEKKKQVQEEAEAMELQARLDREATSRAKPYWASLAIEEQQKIEASFIEAIRKGETPFSPDTNVADFFFKMMKESMLLTWLGYRLEKETEE